MTRLQRKWRRRLVLQICGWFLVSSIVGWSLYVSELDLASLARSGPRFSEFFGRLVPPDWSVTGLVVRSTVETVMIALAGTALAVVVALPLGFLAASNVSPAWIAHSV
jgi:phosphonate transport system permease protein